MIDSGMWSNENFAALPAMARLLQIGIINHADDQGRMKAHPAYLRSQIFPYDDVSIDDLNEWLMLIMQNGTIELYAVDGKEYLQLTKWWDYQSLQYASPSDYPAPHGWEDHIRFNAKGAPNLVLTHNWIKTTGDRLPDTCDCRGNPLVSDTLRTSEKQPSQQGGAPASKQTETPVSQLNKLNLNKLNTTEGRDHARVTEPPAPPKPTHPPAVAIFLEFCTKTVNRTQTDTIASTVVDLDLWRRVLTEWSLRGHNTANVNGLLDWYRDGIPHVSRNGGQHGSNQQRGQPDHDDNAPTLDPAIERQFEEQRARKRARAAAP